jgi:hypothetical protein
VATACREANYSRVIFNVRDDSSSRDNRKRHACQQQFTARIRIPFYSISRKVTNSPKKPATYGRDAGNSNRKSQHN